MTQEQENLKKPFFSQVTVPKGVTYRPRQPTKIYFDSADYFLRIHKQNQQLQKQSIYDPQEEELSEKAMTIFLQKPQKKYTLFDTNKTLFDSADYFLEKEAQKQPKNDGQDFDEMEKMVYDQSEYCYMTYPLCFITKKTLKVKKIFDSADYFLKLYQTNKKNNI